MNILQLTDLHLFTDRASRLLGLDSRASCEAVVAMVLERQLEFDCVLLTGDLIQDDKVSTYQVVSETVAPLGKPMYWLSGNHDIPNLQTPMFGDSSLIRDDKIIEGDDWVIILLDSMQPGKVAGMLSPSELSFLEGNLQANKGKHVMIGLHHHPVDIGARWLNPLGLLNRDAFWSIVSRFPEVRLVLWGHIHQAFSGTYQHIHLLATPSTCIQFDPHSEHFNLDTQLPGCRTLRLLKDGTIETRVHRLTDFEMTLDLAAKGYSI